jgi:hypothetical protein
MGQAATPSVGSRPRATRLAGLILILPDQVAVRFRADHGQKSEPAKEGCLGVTTKGPLQKGVMYFLRG